jgi:hypothetical protein
MLRKVLCKPVKVDFVEWMKCSDEVSLSKLKIPFPIRANVELPLTEITTHTSRPVV